MFFCCLFVMRIYHIKNSTHFQDSHFSTIFESLMIYWFVRTGGYKKHINTWTKVALPLLNCAHVELHNIEKEFNKNINLKKKPSGLFFKKLSLILWFRVIHPMEFEIKSFYFLVNRINFIQTFRSRSTVINYKFSIIVVGCKRYKF